MRNLLVLGALLLAACGNVLGANPNAPEMPGPGGGPASPPPAAVDAGSADTGCGGMQFALTRVPPNVMLVLDRSGSMNDSIGGGSQTSKWDDLKSAVQSLVSGYDSQMLLGDSIFSSDGDCAPGNPSAPAAMSGQSVLNQLGAQGPGGNTPTAATLDKVRTSNLLADPGRSNYVVLATDGLPNCGDTDVTSKIAALYSATPSVKTFVIGVGDATASNPTLLNQWAVAGHTDRTGAPTQYYQASSPSDLQAAFQAIAGSVVSCTFQLAQKAPDPSQLYVYENGQPVAADPMNGFSYDDAGPTVTLNGTACATLQQNPQATVQVVYGCPAPPPIP